MDAIEAGHLRSLAAMVQRIVTESGNPEGFDALAWTSAWIQEPVPALGGARPVDYLGTEEGKALVEALLRQEQSGAYS